MRMISSLVYDIAGISFRSFILKEKEEGAPTLAGLERLRSQLMVQV